MYIHHCSPQAAKKKKVLSLRRFNNVHYFSGKITGIIMLMKRGILILRSQSFPEIYPSKVFVAAPIIIRRKPCHL